MISVLFILRRKQAKNWYFLVNENIQDDSEGACRIFVEPKSNDSYYRNLDNMGQIPKV
jgi:hypothetical protein